MSIEPTCMDKMYPQNMLNKPKIPSFLDHYHDNNGLLRS